MKIAWIVSDLRVTIASTRYRCFYPALGLLREFGHQSAFFSMSDAALPLLGNFDVLVFVKRVDGTARRLANEARKAGKAIYLDLCDNIIVSRYAQKLSYLDTMDLC